MEQYLHMVKQEQEKHMVGDFENEEKKAIIPRAFDYIFDKIKKIQKKKKKPIFQLKYHSFKFI